MSASSYHRMPLTVHVLAVSKHPADCLVPDSVDINHPASFVVHHRPSNTERQGTNMRMTGLPMANLVAGSDLN